MHAASQRGDSSGDRVHSGRAGTNTAVAPDRDGETTRGRAVPRRPGAGSSGNGTTVVVANPGYWGGYYPWGYAGLGLGGYYGGLYDPWWYNGGGYSGYAADGYGSPGSLRLKMKPRHAEVYVDGYFAGQVDDFDGVFQRLKLEAGPHRVEVREEGFEPLMFEILIQADRTMTYEGALQALVGQ